MLLNLGSVAPSWAAPKTAAKPTASKLAGKISEVSPPEVIQQLNQMLEKYQPQVSIVSPRQNEVLDDNTVSVRFTVKDLPSYKDEKLGLGPHLHVFLDDQPYQAIYDVSQPVVFKDLAAGTHTIRAFAGRPWHESFKNEGAYAQTTFHVFTKTPNNNPDPKLPLLTYSRPQATYGAEPILLDFYLTNAPLHIVAQEDDKDDVADWRVKVTANGDSFTLDRWQPIYLKGFKPGKNWVQLEYVDEKGNPIQNVYNNTARVFGYEPNGQDTLSKLVRGEIPFEQAAAIVDPNYKPVIEAPKVTPTPEPSPVPIVPPVEEEPTEPEVEETPKPVEEAPKPAETAKPQGGFFNRFKRAEPKPSIVPTVEPSPEPEAPTIEPPATVAPEQPEPETPTIVAPETPVEKPQGGFFNRFKRPTAPIIPPVVVPSPESSVITEPEEAEPEEVEQPKIEQPKVTIPVTPEAPAAKAAPGGFFNRFKRPNIAPVVPAPIPDEVPPDAKRGIEEPASIEESQPEVEKAVEKAPEPIQPAPAVKETPKANFFDRFKRPESKPSIVLPSPTPVPDDLSVPEVETPVETKPAEPEEIEIKPAPTVKEAPKPNFFDRFKRPESKPPIVLPSPTPIPKDLSIPEVETPVETEPVETKPAEPEVKPEPKPNLLERLRPATPKPVEPPVQPAKPPLVKEPINVEEPPVIEEPTSEPAPNDFEPQTELERRLGMPLKPRISQPASPEPALSSERVE
ncbi:MAG: hypothetical protein C4288_03190 [Leptolyngbya sp. ERB_1_1]